MDTIGIELTNVSKCFRAQQTEKPALQNLTLQIPQGEYVGILGANGSGKSTLVRLLNGLISPTAGTVRIDNLDTTDPAVITEIRKRVGVVFQNPDNQLLCPIIEEEIAFGPENLGLSLAEVNRRVEWALQAVGLEDLRHHSPQLLSGGQKQKVVLASVLAMLPDYLILDEPTSMLDPQSREELLTQLRTLHTYSGMTILLCSHDPEDVRDAQRLIVIDRGTLVLEGTPHHVFAQEPVLAALGITPPGVYQLINYLRKHDHEIPAGIKSIPELVELLCPK